MNSKKQLKISGFIIAIAIILILCIIFLLAVQVPFLQKKDTYEASHASAVSQINYYNSYLDNASAVESNIASMLEEYQTKNPILYSNAAKTPNEIRAMLKNLKYEVESLSISTGNEDTLGRMTVEGGALYSTSISFGFSGSVENLKKTLDYLELKADGAYYINSISVEPYVDTGSSSGATVSNATGGVSSKYTFGIRMSLYYFEKVEIAVASSSSASSAA